MVLNLKEEYVLKKDKKWFATVEQRLGVLNVNLMNSKIEASLYFCAMRNNHIGQHILQFLFSCDTAAEKTEIRS